MNLETCTVSPISLSVDPLPAFLDVDYEAIRSHCHIINDPAWVDDLTLYTKAAVYWAENTMHRTILTRNHRWVLSGFPFWGYQGIRLPRGKAESVTSIVYSSNFQNLTLTGPSASPPGSGFTQDLSSEDGAWVYPPAGSSWPSSDYQVAAPVAINYVAGYSSFLTVPDEIMLAIYFYISDAFEIRGTADIDKSTYYDRRAEILSGYILNRTYR